jgi:hypothetical protein
MASEAIHEFVGCLKCDSEQAILVKKGLLVKILLADILSDISTPAKSANFDPKELWKGLDPSNKKDHLSCCQLLLGFQAERGTRESKVALVRLNAVIWLDNLSKLGEIKQHIPTIVSWLKDPGAQLEEESYQRKMKYIWKGLEIGAHICSALMEHW